jgi:hypothetical protein
MRVILAALILAGPALAEIAWLKDYETARLKARAEGKLLFIDFWSPG